MLRFKIILIAMLVTLISVFAFASSCVSPMMEGPRPVHWATPHPLESGKNLHMVTPDLYRSAQPDAQAMRDYEKIGIRTVINMRVSQNDLDEAEGTNLVLEHYPVTTWDITDEDVVAVLALIRTSQAPVLLHCRHGADRTGLMVAMYRLVEQGWSKEEALEEMQKGGYGFHTIWSNIPEYVRKVDVEDIRRKVDAASASETMDEI